MASKTRSMAKGNFKPGVIWVPDNFFSTYHPEWTQEPDMETIETLARKHLKLGSDSACEVSFYAEGALNKLYKIAHTTGTWLMRVALPVDPYFKMASEMATLKFVRANTDTPVPAILAHDGSLGADNPLGYEWMIMEQMPGRPLRYAWRKMSWEKKENLVRQLARYQAQLYAQKYNQVGNLYRDDGSDNYRIARLVTVPFFWRDCVSRGEHGPFRNSYGWLYAQLSLIIDTWSKAQTELEEEDEREDATRNKLVGEALREFLPEMFPQDESEETIVFHDDLSMRNTLVDDEGNLTAVVDWECVSAMPKWQACQPPKLLQGHIRTVKPERSEYAQLKDYPNEEDQAGFFTPGMDNEGVDRMYWEHLLEYETTQLRELFADEMERLVPGWQQNGADGVFRRDFLENVYNVDNGQSHWASDWLKEYREGNRVTLEEEHQERWFKTMGRRL